MSVSTSIPKAKLPKLFFPILDNGGGTARIGWAVSMIAAAASVLRKYDLLIESMAFPYPDGNANIATQYFMESDCDELIFIDIDVVFKPEHLAMLLSHDVPFVAGIYPKKKLGLEFPVVLLDETDPREAFRLNGSNPLVEVECAARGFYRIKREVFEVLRKHPDVPYYHCIETKRMQHEYWRNAIGGYSDDFNFCRRWREMGGKVWVDKRCLLEHAGNINYPVKGSY
jgi:hypothetical protein